MTIRPLHINLADGNGGAHIAAHRIHRALRRVGTPSEMLVHRKFTDDPTVHGPTSDLARGLIHTVPSLDFLPVRFYRRRPTNAFSPNWVPSLLGSRIRRLAPDLLHLHWVCGGCLRPESIPHLGLPVVWTMHDAWAATGGCNYPGTCTRYRDRCGRCPHLGSNWEWDLSRRSWNRKRRAWNRLNLHIVTPSRWLAGLVRESSLLGDHPIEVIPNGLDLSVFRPHDRSEARQILGLPPDRRLLLFSALSATSDPRKGFALLVEALSALHVLVEEPEQIELVVLGASEPTDPPPLGFRTHYRGLLRDELTTALHYAAADLLVAPSTEDNLPSTVVESLACGTPAVAFDLGGFPDLIDPGSTGALARPLDPADLAGKLAGVLQADPVLLRANCRLQAEQRYSMDRCASAYRALYERIS